jgi:hypothetical protein
MQTESEKEYAMSAAQNSPADDPTDYPPPQPTNSSPTSPPSNSSPTSPPSQGCDSNCDAQHAALISADVDAGSSGLQVTVDILGHNLADVSIGLGLVDSVLDLADSRLGLVDSLMCDIV